MKKSLLLLLALLAIPLTGQGISRKDFFAEIVNRSNVHQRVKSLDKGLSSRDLFSYAFFVCESETNLDQLDDIFKHAARMQDRDKTSAGYGNYRWSWRETAWSWISMPSNSAWRRGRSSGSSTATS